MALWMHAGEMKIQDKTDVSVRLDLPVAATILLQTARGLFQLSF